MKFSRELKLGILALIVIFGMIWGYKYVIGQNLLKPSRTFYVNYKDVTGLAVSAPVKINGYPIGSVTNISLNKDNVSEMTITLKIEDKAIKFPKSTQALLASEGLVGGKYIILKFSENCQGDNCAESGDYLVSKELGMIGSMLGDGELEGTVNTVTEGLSEILDSLGAEGQEGKINDIFRNLESITANLAELTGSTNSFMKNSQRNMELTMANFSEITGVIARDREKISGLISNLDSITGSLASADIGKVVKNSDQAILATTEAIKEFENTLSTTESTMTNLNNLLNKIESGEGSLSKLLTDEKLYTNLEFTSKNLALLLQDLRLNPRRYISVSVFGKDQKEYTPADEDPAFDDEWEIRKINKGN